MTVTFAFMICALATTFTVGTAFGIFALAFFQGATQTDFYD